MEDPWILKFPPYDLKQDLLKEEIQSLKSIAMAHASASFFKREDIIKEIHNIWDMVINSDMIYYERKEWKTLVKRVESIFLSNFDSPTNEIKEQICSMNYFVGNQIYKFFWKEVPLKEIFLFFRNFVFTSQGTINTYKTIIRILDKEDLTKEFKFTLACKYFIEERIKVYFDELSEPVQQWLKKFKYLKLLSCTPLYYWSRKIKGKKWKIEIDSNKIDTNYNPDSNVDDIDLSLLVADLKIYENYPETHLLRWAITTKNDIAVQYLWKNEVSSSEGVVEILNELCKELANFGNHNIFIYLFRETTHLSMEWHTYQTPYILKHLFIDCRWRNSNFIEIIEYLENIQHFNGYLTMNKIILEIQKKTNPRKEREKYWEILGDCVVKIPTYKFINNGQLFKLLNENVCDILFPCVNKNNSKLLKLICDIIKIKTFGLKFLHSIKSVFNTAVSKKDFNFIEVVLKDVSNSEEEYKSLKKYILEENAFEMCEYLIANNEWETLDEFMDWFSKFYSIDEANKLRSSVPVRCNATLIRELISKGVGLSYTQYPTNSSESLNMRLNEEIEEPALDEEGYGEIIRSLDRLLTWSLESEVEINNFKRYFFQIPKNLPEVTDNKIISHIYNFLVQLVKEEKFTFLDELINWSLCSIKDIKAFKEQLPKDSKKMKDFSKVDNLLGFFKYIEWSEKLDY